MSVRATTTINAGSILGSFVNHCRIASGKHGIFNMLVILAENLPTRYEPPMVWHSMY